MASREKKELRISERDEIKRIEFVTELAKIAPDKRVYVDESGMDECSSDYGYGWCEKGNRFDSLKPGKRTGRVNMISAYSQKQLFAPFTVEGSCNRNVFET